MASSRPGSRSDWRRARCCPRPGSKGAIWARSAPTLNEGAVTAAKAAGEAGKAELAAIGISRMGANEQVGKLLEGFGTAIRSAGSAASESRKRNGRSRRFEAAPPPRVERFARHRVRRLRMSKLHLVFGGRVKDPTHPRFRRKDDRGRRHLRRLCAGRKSLARRGAAHGRRCRDEVRGGAPAPAARAERAAQLAHTS